MSYVEDWANMLCKKIDGEIECLTYPDHYVVDKDFGYGRVRFEWDGHLNFLVSCTDLVQFDYLVDIMKKAQETLRDVCAANNKNLPLRRVIK